MKHSVTIEDPRCRGCTSCIKACPMEAIRVREKKARILDVRCVDCGICIRICPHRAAIAESDGFGLMHKFHYSIALPEPALYGQFHNMDDIDLILNGLQKIGFHKVFEVARGAEYLSAEARRRIQNEENKRFPQISSSCPAVMRLIQVRFPKLVDHLNPMILPMEMAAIMARREAVAETGLDPSDIGVFAIVPCSAKVTAVRESDGLEQTVLDGALAVRDVYIKLLSTMKQVENIQPVTQASIMGASWAYSGGESASLLGESTVAVDGIENCVRMLEDIEDGRIPDARFIELSACVQGCVGGCLNVENPFVARMRIRQLMRGLPVSREQFVLPEAERFLSLRNKQQAHLPGVLRMDDDRTVAFEKMRAAAMIEKQLPGLHCGSCGAPNCQAHAEDVVLGIAGLEDCVFLRGKKEKSES
jgi:Iron only hydrogenase large subunit, C-terminal domain